jgi:A/G-specific adenine glycosylase
VSPNPAKLAGILLKFYKTSARDLPWRRTTDPYAIWISEVMLQQTQVQTVVPRFEKFLRRFPTVEHLAGASEGAVCEEFAGLGYYHRARNLHRAAVAIVDHHDGKLPSTPEGLRALPGIGEYTAAAIAAIAFGVPVPSVDGNLVRVLSRIFTLPGKAGDKALRQAVHGHAAEMVKHGPPGEINQALMDVGATICSPDDPACGDCPLARLCGARALDTPERFPGKKTATKRAPLAIAFAMVRGEGGLLLEQRPLVGLWPGLWEPPSATGKAAKRALEKRLGARLSPGQATIGHTLTHRDVLATVHTVSGKSMGAPAANQRFVPDPLAMPLSTLAKKAILAWGKSAELTGPATVPPLREIPSAARRKNPGARP